MEMKQAIQMPVKDKDNLIRFLIGGLLDIFPIVNLFSSGYAFLMMKHHITEEPLTDLPEWDNWGTLFKYGLLTFLGSLGYVIIPLLIIGLGTAATYPKIGILTFFGATFIVAGVICALAAIFFYPMGLILFAIEDDFSAIFSFFRIVDLIFKNFWSYFKVFIVIFVMGLILGLLSNIPFVGWIIGVFIGFYILIETALLMGDVGREILSTEAGQEPVTAVEPAPAHDEPASAPATALSDTKQPEEEASEGETEQDKEEKN